MSEIKTYSFETTVIKPKGWDSDRDFILTGRGLWLEYGDILLHIYRPFGTEGEPHVDRVDPEDVDRELQSIVMEDWR